MKKFNINDNILIKITDNGWEYLGETVGEDYIKHCVDTESRRHLIDGIVWHELQMHHVFDLFPISAYRSNCGVLFETTILIP
jgi:hypothetical protein